MQLQGIELGREDFENSNWEAALSESERQECELYDLVLSRKAKEAEEAGDIMAQEVFTLMHMIASYSMQLDNRDEPFGPKMRWFANNTRSAIPDDIPDIHLPILFEIVPDVKDPEMRARIADVLWIRGRDYRMAELAIDAYLESAQILENWDSWPSCADRIRRALQLAAQLGKNSPKYNAVISHIEGVLAKYDGEDPTYLSARLMTLLLEQRMGDATKYIPLAEKAAKKAESEQDLHRAREYWQMKAGWYNLAGDENGSKNARILAAETYVTEAELRKKRSYLAASQIMRQAIEAYRRIGGEPQRVLDLQRQLLEYERQSLGEMQHFSADFDHTSLAEMAREHVKGRKYPEVLFVLSLMGVPSKKSEVRKRTVELVSEAPLQFLIGAKKLGQDGKVIAQRPSVLTNEREALEAAMFETLIFNQNFHVLTTIEPARLQIDLEHSIGVRDLLQIVSDNPFVPPGREWIFARGLHAGLRGDFLISTGILIPQLEDSVRYVLFRSGVITSGLDKKFIQEDYDLNRTLRMPEFAQIFGEDLQFDLQGLLIERFGSNLRNRVAHGLMHIREYYDSPCAYLWWITLRLCCIACYNTNPGFWRADPER